MNTSKLKKYASLGLNVMLSGSHGVGKTEIIKEVFNETFGVHRENWLYFSGSTLDPWVDFIGIPKNYTRSDGKEVFGIIPNENFTGEQEIKAIFIDEINRADPKVLNAVMELLQFKSINGRPFPHLICIWCAVNPDDDEKNDYDVEKLDPAQEDRFEIKIDIPNVLNRSYFEKKYSKEYYQVASSWWEDKKDKISPRRMDKMLEGYIQGVDLKDYVNKSVDVNSLKKSLYAIGELSSINAVIDAGRQAITDYFTIERINNLAPIFKQYDDIAERIYKHLDHEVASRLGQHASKKMNEQIKNYISSEVKKEIESDFDSNQNRFTSKNKIIINKNTIDNHFVDFIADFSKYFGEKDFEKIAKYNDSVFNLENGDYQTHEIRKFTQEIDLRKLDAEFRNFYTALAYCLLNAISVSKEVINLFSKMSRSNDVVRDFNINRAIATDIMKYMNGKKKTKPEISLLFS